MADVMEQARTAVARHQLALFDAGRINVVVIPAEDVRWLLTALCDRERETVLAVAQMVQDRMALKEQSRASAERHGRTNVASHRQSDIETLRATLHELRSRWPDYVPKAEAP